ncbi:MAG: WecB/TagA/CpsF family glycosyltransferase [Bacteroidetes bacterium]|nr:WecB/TagA/CpsF family glycosyltransferase [Bacteroidota bacterium]
MQKYFNVFLEFNHSVFYGFIEESIKNRNKGYVCVVDANVLTMAQKNLSYQQILNNSLINTCDGSSIAVLAGWAHHQKFKALNGPEIFEYYIEKDFKHLLLGSTPKITDRIKEVLICKKMNALNLQTISLPFVPVECFDYQSIANEINNIEHDIIWVSLGAPKQEIFMYKLVPLLNHGVLFGIGAAFNFYIGDLNVPRFKIGGLRFIWLNRLFNEPKKLIRRLLSYIVLIPGLYLEEIKKNNK